MWVVVGASAGLGRALAGELAGRGHDLVLLSSDRRDLEPLASDLTLRHGVCVSCVEQDAGNPGKAAEALFEACDRDGKIEGLMFPLGHSRDDDDGFLPAPDADRLVAVNFLTVAAVVSRFLPRLLAQGNGHVVGFGSVAASRGRGKNVVYAAAKRALASYFESLRCLAEPRGVAVSFWTLGYLDTNLSWGKELPLPAASPREAAARVCRRLGKGSGTWYYPAWWLPATLVVRALPGFLFRRMGV